MADFEDVRAIGERLRTPVVSSFGCPALRLPGGVLARLREDGVTLVLRTPPGLAERLCRRYRPVVYTTGHYPTDSMVLITLPSVDRGTLADLVRQAWSGLAPRPAVRSRGHAALTPPPRTPPAWPTTHQ
jgi:hypothetical protein